MVLRLQASLVAILSSLGVRANGQSAAQLTPCAVRGLAGDVRCGSVRVAEDPRKPNGRRIDLRVVVARATGSDRASDPLVLLAGGPGQAGTDMGEFATEAFSRVRVSRDLVLVDARGTGGSGSLRCALMRSSADLVGPTMYPPASVRFCHDSLSRVADLTRYTTADIADDLEVVRKALGYPRVNLYGTSYGTRLALAYMRRHPASVRAVVLKAVAPPTMVAPMNYAVDAERAFGLLVRDCRADSACARAFPSPRADLDTVLARAARGELRASVPNGPARVDTLPIARDAIAAALLTLMQSSHQRVMIPKTLHAAAGGAVQQLAFAVMQTRLAIDAAIASGMHLSVSCADDGARLDTTAAARSDAGTFLGPSRVRVLADACREWPMPRSEPAAVSAVRSRAPVLLVSGELDPNTPPRHADAALRMLPNGRHVVLAGVAHGWSNVAGCGAAFVADFIARASVTRLDVACASVSSAPRFLAP